MKGFLFKEFALAKKALLLILGISVIMAIMIISSIISEIGDISYAKEFLPITSVYIFVIVSMVNPQFFKIDEKPTWCSFVMSSPANAKAHVQSKYCFMLIINLYLLFVCFVMDTIAVAIVGTSQISSLTICATIFCLQTIINAFEFPFYIRFGSSKGGNVKASVIGVLLLAAAVYALFGNITFLLGDDPLGAIYDYYTSGNAVWISALLPYVTAVIYFASYKISLKLYQKGVESYER